MPGLESGNGQNSENKVEKSSLKNAGMELNQNLWNNAVLNHKVNRQYELQPEKLYFIISLYPLTTYLLTKKGFWRLTERQILSMSWIFAVTKTIAVRKRKGAIEATVMNGTYYHECISAITPVRPTYSGSRERTVSDGSWQSFLLSHLLVTALPWWRGVWNTEDNGECRRHDGVPDV